MSRIIHSVRLGSYSSYGARHQTTQHVVSINALFIEYIVKRKFRNLLIPNELKLDLALKKVCVKIHKGKNIINRRGKLLFDIVGH